MKIQSNQSGVSIALSKTYIALGNEKIEKSSQKEFIVKTANTLEEREEVFKLGYKTYLEKGYIKKNVTENLICEYDFDQETVILIVLDKQKNIAGSVTLVFEDSIALPAEKVYGKELNKLKNYNKKTAELCRFVINSEYRNSKEILILLFNYAAIYINKVKRYDGLAIEVTPRHKNYYKSLLDFQELGTEKCCPQVENTIGVLLYQSVSRYRSAMMRNTNCHNFSNINHSLYSYFLSIEQENLVAYYLKNQFRPISQEEKIHFGYSESGINNAVCI